MKIDIIASGSKGNCYKVSDGETTLLIECGIPYKKIQKALNYTLTSIDGCLLTHEHKDHSEAVQDLIKLGIDCYMTEGTANALGFNGYNVKRIKAGRGFFINSIEVAPFDTVHDVAEPVGYLLYSNNTGESLLFITDTMYSPYKFELALDYIMIEVNYVREVINENDINAGLRRRIKDNHMSLDTALGFLKACDLSRTKAIYVMHLSDNNSDEEYIKTEIQKATGVQVIIC